MASILIVLLCAFGKLTALTCCTVAGCVGDAEEAWNKVYDEAPHTT